MAKFKQFLREQKEFTIYCDMDGVISDFVKQVETTFNVKFKDFLKDDKNFWASINSKGEQFWSEMPIMKDGKKLIDFLKKHGFTILTSTGSPTHATKEAKSGKLKWIKKHIGNIDVIVEHSKYKYANENSILIDDLDKNIIPWKAKGGIAIKHTDANSTIKKLKEILGE